MQNLGNFEPGKSGTIAFLMTPEEAGEVKVTLKVNYEDANQELKTKEFPMTFGITNTMIMSISERMREIGIMNALGCYVSDIRTMFLSEAGAIGLIGRIFGSLISIIVSVAMNTASGGGSEMLGMVGQSGVSKISVIPIWLVGFAILFSVFIGLVSGYYPANKAVKISALEAMRNE